MTTKSSTLSRLITEFNGSTQEEEREQIAFQIDRVSNNLEDLLQIMQNCPVDSMPSIKAWRHFIDSIDNRTLSVLVKVYEGMLWEKNLSQTILEFIKTRAERLEVHWLAALDWIAHPPHELSDLVYEHLIGAPLHNVTIFKLHYITRKDSPQRRFLEQVMIYPYLEQMSDLELTDITILADPDSELVARAKEILGDPKVKEAQG